MYITEEQKAIINSPYRKYIYQIEWLDKNENIIDSALVDVISGNVNLDSSSNARRTFNITLRNLDGKYLPSPTSSLWINNKLKLSCGYETLDGRQLLFNQGVYVLGNPNLSSNPTQAEVSLQGLDKMVSLDGTIAGKLKNKYIVPLQIRIDDVIKTILFDAGETKYIVDVCETLTPYTIEYEAGSTYADILQEICNIVSFQFYYDDNGYFRFTKSMEDVDYQTIPSTWDYTQTGLYLESQRELQWSDIRNSVVVYGMTDGALGIQYYATAQDTTGEFSIDNIGERVADPIEDGNIYTSELCQQRGNYELSKYKRLQEKVTANIISNFSHSLDDIISVTDNKNGCIGNYLIQGISYDISYQTTMSLSLYKVN